MEKVKVCLLTDKLQFSEGRLRPVDRVGRPWPTQPKPKTATE